MSPLKSWNADIRGFVCTDVSLELFDMMHATKLEDAALLSKFQEQIENVGTALNPETVGLRGIGGGTLEDEVLTVLGEDWTTVDQVYDELFIDIQVVATQESV